MVNELFADGYFCTTTQVLEYDPTASFLCATPDAPNFSHQIWWISKEIKERLRSSWLNIDTSLDIVDPTQLQLVAIHGALWMLYRTATVRHGAAARETAEDHKATFLSLLETIKLDLRNGQRFSMSGRIHRVG